MPIVGVNVCANPDFSIVGFDGRVAYWRRAYSWEPRLAVSGGDSPSQSVGYRQPGGTYDTWPEGMAAGDTVGGAYYIGPEGMIDPALDCPPGILYSGPGFDAAPGDVWRISFDYQWRKPDDVVGNDHNSIDCSGIAEIFFRYGVTLWNEDTEHWDAWYESLPTAPILLPTDPDTGACRTRGLFGLDGDPLTYDYTFTIPSNFPTTRLQYALCHTPNYFTPEELIFVDTVGLTDHKYGGLSLTVNNVNLQLVSASGVVSDGSSPGDSFYSFWPTPRYAPGYPVHVSADEIDVEWEWDPFQLTNGETDIVMADGVFSSDVTAKTTGMYATWLMKQSNRDLVPVGTHNPEIWTGRQDGTFIPGVGTDPSPLRTASTFPETTDCGPHRAAITAFLYLAVPQWEVGRLSILDLPVYTNLDGAFVVYVHPSVREFDFAGAGYRAFEPDFGLIVTEPGGAEKVVNVFDYLIGCGGLHTWQRI